MLILGGSLVLAPNFSRTAHAQPALPDKQTTEYRDYEATLKRAQALEKTNPQAALDLLQKFGQNHPTLDASVRVALLEKAGEITFDKLNDREGALKIANQSLQEAKAAVEAGAPQFLELRSLVGKSRILLKMDQNAEVQSLLGNEQTWARLAALLQTPTALERSYGDSAFRVLMSSYKKTNQPDLAVSKIEQWIGFNPSMVVSNRNRVLEYMTDNLLQAKKPKEALGWAKVSFMMADFDNKGIADSSRLLAKSWVADKNLDALRDFTKAQSGEAGVANPLKDVALPALIRDAKMQSALRDLAAQWQGEGWTEADDMIGAYLLTAQWGPAMERAYQMWKNNPQSTTGTQQIGRVFKAVDLDTTRGNAFIAFVEGTGGKTNPVETFLQQQAAVPAAG